jgi:hypothetical protein
LSAEFVVVCSENPLAMPKESLGGEHHLGRTKYFMSGGDGVSTVGKTMQQAAPNSRSQSRQPPRQLKSAWRKPAFT